MSKKTIVAVVGIVALVGAGVAFADFSNPRHDEIQKYYPDHTHTVGGDTIDVPEHSGGTDRYGCHNASVPYHCH